MAKVLGIGGVFFKSPDPKALYAWYNGHLGLEAQDWGKSFSPSDMPEHSYTVWSAFKDSADSFAPSNQRFMFNLVVDNLEEALEQVQRGGAQIPQPSETHPYGKFGWFIDPDGNKVELWEPTPSAT
jgi:predicted enzyme related to lactoylglutathione lyase